MSRKKKKKELAKESSPQKPNFILRISEKKADLEMMAPFIDGDDGNLMLWVANNMYRLRKEATETELIVAKHLWRSRVKFICQAPFLISLPEEGEHCYFADFYIPALKVIIELDGSQHSRAEGIARDSMRDGAFAHIGIRTIRIKNRDVHNGTYKDVIPIPPEKFLRPIRITYLKEGESAVTRKMKENKVASILRYGE